MSFAQTWSNQTGSLTFGVENGRTFYGMINVAASWGLYNGLKEPFEINIAPMEYVHYALSRIIGDSLWNEKHKRSEDRKIRGYSKYGSMNYPWLVSLAGDLDVLQPGEKFGLFSRGWKMYFPEKCELED